MKIFTLNECCLQLISCFSISFCHPGDQRKSPNPERGDWSSGEKRLRWDSQCGRCPPGSGVMQTVFGEELSTSHFISLSAVELAPKYLTLSEALCWILINKLPYMIIPILSSSLWVQFLFWFSRHLWKVPLRSGISPQHYIGHFVCIGATSTASSQGVSDQTTSFSWLVIPGVPFLHPQ